MILTAIELIAIVSIFNPLVMMGIFINLTILFAGVYIVRKDKSLKNGQEVNQK